MDRFRSAIVLLIALLALMPGCRKAPPKESARAGAPSPPPPPPRPDVPLTGGEIRESDRGKNFAVTEGDRFTVILDPAKHPPQTLDVLPRGNLARDAEVPSLPPPLYAVRFRAVKPGTCLLTAKGFLVRIQVREKPKTAS